MKTKFLLILSFMATNCYSAEESKKDEALEAAMKKAQKGIAENMDLVDKLKPTAFLNKETIKQLQEKLGQLSSQTSSLVNIMKQVLLLRDISGVQSKELKQIPLILIIVDAILLNLPEGSNELDLFITEAKKFAPISNKEDLKEYLITTNHNLNKLMIWLISTVNTQQALDYQPNRFFNSLFKAIQQSKDQEGMENYKQFITHPNHLEAIFKIMLLYAQKGMNVSNEEFINAFKSNSNNDPAYRDNLIKACIKKCKEHEFAGKRLFNSMLNTMQVFKEMKSRLAELALIC